MCGIKIYNGCRAVINLNHITKNSIKIIISVLRDFDRAEQSGTYRAKYNYLEYKIKYSNGVLHRLFYNKKSHYLECRLRYIHYLIKTKYNCLK